MSKEKKKKNEYFGTFLEKEILTANRYDGDADEKEGEEKEGDRKSTRLNSSHS